MTSCFRGPVRSIQYFIVCFIVLLMPLYSFAGTLIENKIKMFRNKDRYDRMSVVKRLKGKKDEETVEFLINVAGYKSEAWKIKAKAIQFLGEIKNPKAVTLLLSIFNSDSLDYECPAIKTYTAIALGNFSGDTDVLNALIKGINNNEPLVREASIKALGNIGNKDAVPYLVPLLIHKSIAVRIASIRALERIGDLQTVPYLQTVAEKDSDADVRDAAKTALNNFQGNKTL